MPGTGQRGAAGEGVQHQLPVGEVHALGQAGGAGGVEGGGAGVFVQLREIEFSRGLLQQGFVLAGNVQLGIQVAAFVVQQHVAFDGFDAVFQLFENRQKLPVHQNHVVLGVVQGVENLFRAQAHVHRVQHRAHHRDGEERFQVTVGVPVHHRHGVTCLHAGCSQHVGQPRDTLIQGAVVVTQLVTVDDLAGALVAHAGQQQALDQQRVLVSVRRGLDDTGLQHEGHPVLVGVVNSTLERPPPGKISPKDYFPRTSFQRVNRSRLPPGVHQGRSARRRSACRTSGPFAQTQHARGLG